MAEAAKPLKNFTVVFLRHGESEWTQKNIYCGWYDSDITRNGENEAEKAGEILKESGFVFDEAYTSVLRRSGKTLDIILDVLKQSNIPVYKSWRLNARHYGALTGLSKSESIRKYGEEQIRLWRRSYDISPPEITKDNPYYDRIMDESIYNDGPKEFPLFESLKQAIDRTTVFWKETIEPSIQSGKNVLIIGHMNSLRAIIKLLDRISDEKIMEYNIPTGIPFIYELNSEMKPIISLKFLGDEEYVQKANETLRMSGRGFERPKRSKPTAVLEVYASLSRHHTKLTENLKTVQSENENLEKEPKVAEEIIIENIDEKNVEKTQVDVEETQVDVEKSEKDMKKTEKGVEETEIDAGEIQIDVEEAHIDVEKSEKDVKKSQIDVETFETNVGKFEIEVADSEIDLEKFENEVAETEKEKTEIDIEKIKNDVKKIKKYVEKIENDVEEIQIVAEKSQIVVEKSQIDVEKSQIDVEKSQIDEEKSQIDAEKSQIDAEETQGIEEKTETKHVDKIEKVGQMLKIMEKSKAKDSKSDKSVKINAGEYLFDDLVAEDSIDLISQEVDVDDKVSKVTVKMSISQAAVLIKDSHVKETKTDKALKVDDKTDKPSIETRKNDL